MILSDNGLNAEKSAVILLLNIKMKNKTILIFAVSIIFLFVLGCGITDRIKRSVGGKQVNTNSGSVAPSKTVGSDSPANTDTADVTPDSEKIGIPECDEVFDMITEQMKPKEDDTYISKATKDFYLSKIRESFREGIKNEKDRDKLTDNCKKYLEQLKKYKAEEESKK